jgi:hypothetical protein
MPVTSGADTAQSSPTRMDAARLVAVPSLGVAESGTYKVDVCRVREIIKFTQCQQCYSPLTQQVVRHNIAFSSPGGSPVPSPTRRHMRSLSPIASRPMSGQNGNKTVGMKRKYTMTGNDALNLPSSTITNDNGGGSTPKRLFMGACASPVGAFRECVHSDARVYNEYTAGLPASPLAGERPASRCSSNSSASFVAPHQLLQTSRESGERAMMRQRCARFACSSTRVTALRWRHSTRTTAIRVVCSTRSRVCRTIRSTSSCCSTRRCQAP